MRLKLLMAGGVLVLAALAVAQTMEEPATWVPLSGAWGLKLMPPRLAPMASISSMKPMAPPSRWAVLRSWRK